MESQDKLSCMVGVYKCEWNHKIICHVWLECECEWNHKISCHAWLECISVSEITR